MQEITPVPTPPQDPPPDDDAFGRFRRDARLLLAAGIPPEAAHDHWQACGPPSTQSELFSLPPRSGSIDDDANRGGHTAPSPVRVPRLYRDLAQRVVLHASPQRFTLLYRLLWRLQHEPALRHDLLDPDWLTLRQMARAVRREAYRMRAFLRFRPVHESTHGSAPAAPPAPGHHGHDPDAHVTGMPAPLHVAWFDPEHDVLSLVAPWFVRRFAGMRWAILTPRGSIDWDPASQQLRQGPAARADQAPAADAGEALWLTYYRHTFNPARLNLPLMQRHMPHRYRASLPEACEIMSLAADAPRQVTAMTKTASQAPAPCSSECMHARADKSRRTPRSGNPPG
ncbi:MAG: TIGR03915 family putative DNA repair protein [Lautropia sp.]|nr:TIGR03915 family putative DNA repair protein [Lautropia sp.]